MKMYLIIGLIFIVCSASHCTKSKLCKKGHNGLTVINNSTLRISFTFYWNYPDSTIGEINPGPPAILPGDSLTRGAGRTSCWEEVFANEMKEWIYIFDQDTLDKLDWSTVKQTNRGLLERRELDLNYLQLNDFSVPYP